MKIGNTKKANLASGRVALGGVGWRRKGGVGVILLEALPLADSTIKRLNIKVSDLERIKKILGAKPQPAGRHLWVSADDAKFLQDKDVAYQNPTPPNATLRHHRHPTPPNATLPDESKNHLIKSLLLKGNQPPAQLKCGIHRNRFYFGITLGKYPAVVTSDRKIYVGWRGKDSRDDIREDFGLLYRYDFQADVLDGFFSHAGARRWLYDGVKPRSLKEIFSDLARINRAYVVHDDPFRHSIIALDILSTYFLPLFSAKGRTFFDAEPGSGKTRQSTIYKLLSCNSLMTADVSKAAFFRLMESTVSSLIVDDFDALGEEQKQDVIQHYRVGYKNSSRSVRVSDHPSRRIDAFRSYGHCVSNNTSGLSRTDAERTLFIPIMRGQGKAADRRLDDTPQAWQSLRDDLYIAALAHWRRVEDAYNRVQSKMTGRQLELVRPLLAVAKALGHDHLVVQTDRWLRKRLAAQQEISVDPDSDWGFLALGMFAGQSTGYTIRLADLALGITERLLAWDDRQFSKTQHGIAIYLGRFFNKLPCFEVIIIRGSRHVRLTSLSKFSRYLKQKGDPWKGLTRIKKRQLRVREERVK